MLIDRNVLGFISGIEKAENVHRSVKCNRFHSSHVKHTYLFEIIYVFVSLLDLSKAFD
jgi:hypothetical protein